MSSAFFDDKLMLSMGWPLPVVEALKQCFQASNGNFADEAIIKPTVFTLATLPTVPEPKSNIFFLLITNTRYIVSTN